MNLMPNISSLQKLLFSFLHHSSLLPPSFFVLEYFHTTRSNPSPYCFSMLSERWVSFLSSPFNLFLVFFVEFVFFIKTPKRQRWPTRALIEILGCLNLYGLRFLVALIFAYWDFLLDWIFANMDLCSISWVFNVKMKMMYHMPIYLFFVWTWEYDGENKGWWSRERTK